MNSPNFPLDARFKLLAIASQITVSDAGGRLLYYARQKAFKLREAVTIFADEHQTQPLYRIAADRILDFSARYRIEDAGGAEIGIIQRRGMRSFWRAHYEVELGGRTRFVIREENPWVKVLDSIVGDIPIVSLFAGYFLHPAYRLSHGDGDSPLLRVVKRPALFEGRFRIEAPAPPAGPELDLAVVSVLMMLLLERSRG
jgi:hypothetical protein